MKTIPTSFLFLLSGFAQLSCFAQPCLDTTTYIGSATSYNVFGPGNCSFPVPSLPIYIAAINSFQYDTAATCGACALVTGPMGSVTVSIEDLCPGCAINDFDLSSDAFNQIADSTIGNDTINWHFVGCPVIGAVKIFIDGTSTSYYLAAHVRNHRYAVKKLEVSSGGSPFQQMTRQSYNLFTYSPVTALDSVLTFRITDILNNDITEGNIPLAPDSLINGVNQFPLCEGTGIEQNRAEIPLHVFPNPFSNQLTFSLADNEPATVSLYDFQGQQVFRQTYTFSTTINTVQLAEGIYFYELRSSNGTLKFGKVIRQ